MYPLLNMHKLITRQVEKKRIFISNVGFGSTLEHDFYTGMQNGSKLKRLKGLT